MDVSKHRKISSPCQVWAVHCISALLTKTDVLNGPWAGSWREQWRDRSQVAVTGKRQEVAEFTVSCSVTGVVL